MITALEIDKTLSNSEIYNRLLPQIEGMINTDEPLITNLANFIAILKEAFEKISWIGFYLRKEEKLFLGPFQGKVACTAIELGNGVCGTAWEKKETIIVEDVDKFPGHIACDSNSRSEIVVPLLKDGDIYGVLDLDSSNLSSFNDDDKKYLEIFAGILTQKLEFSKMVL
ncbi:MAG: GAF domain-containing protein [Melioribacteraceae bacterium]